MQLLEIGGNVICVDDYGVTPLHIEADHGRVELVKLLLEKGAMIDAKTDAMDKSSGLAAGKEQHEKPQALNAQYTTANPAPRLPDLNSSLKRKTKTNIYKARLQNKCSFFLL